MIHDYFGISDIDVQNGANPKKYLLDLEDAFKLVEKIIYGNTAHDFSFYTEDDEICLLDLS